MTAVRQAGRKVDAAERTDRMALQLVRDESVCTRGMVARHAGRTALGRLVKRGYVVRDAASEYSDALALTWDGLDYLAVLEER